MLVAPGLASAENPVASDAARLLRDAPAYALQPARWEASEWAGLGLAVGAVAGVLVFDEGIRDLAQDHRSRGSDRVARWVRGFGEPLGWGGGAAAATYLGGLVAGSDPLRRAGLDLVESAVFVSVATEALKVASGRSRPEAEDGSLAFRPLGGRSDRRASFPSGHVTVAFALAAAAAENAPGLGWLTYPLAGLVGLSRITDDKHWASDVVAGAALGTATGLWVARRPPPGEASHTRRSRDRSAAGGSGIAIVPWAVSDGLGLAACGKY